MPKVKGKCIDDGIYEQLTKAIDRFEQDGQIESFPDREFPILPIGNVISRHGARRAICIEVRDTRENVHITRKFPSNLISNDSKCVKVPIYLRSASVQVP